MRMVFVLIIFSSWVIVFAGDTGQKPDSAPPFALPDIESVEKANDAYLTAIKMAKEKYAKALQALSDAEQKKGNLDGIEELKSEINKMIDPATTTSKTEFKTSAARKMQDAFRKDADSARKKCIADLQDCQSREVKAGNLDGAKAIRDYVGILKVDREYTTDTKPIASKGVIVNPNELFQIRELKVGTKVFTNREYAFMVIEEQFKGMAYLAPPGRADAELIILASQNAKIYLALQCSLEDFGGIDEQDKGAWEIIPNATLKFGIPNGMGVLHIYKGAFKKDTLLKIKCWATDRTEVHIIADKLHLGNCHLK